MDKFLRNNNVLRILALLLACIIWLTVHAPADTTQSTQQSQWTNVTSHYVRTINVQVSPDMVVTSISQSTANISVTTTLSKTVGTLPTDMEKVKLIANAQGLGAGNHVVPIAAVNMPTYAQRTIQPKSVTVVLAKKVSEQKPIVVNVKGSPAKGEALGTLKLNTQSVEVSGAHKQVKQVKQVVGSINVGGMDQSDTKIVSLTPVDKHGHAVSDVQVSPTSVSVYVPIQVSQQKVNLQPEITGTPAPGYAVADVKLNTTEVNEVGLGKDQLPDNGLNVPVDVSNLTKSKTINVSVPLLQGMTSVTPTTVAATVTIAPSATITLKRLPVSVQNESKGAQVTLPGNPKVDVTLTGPKSLIQGLSKSDVQVYVDAANLKSNSTKAPVTVHVPQWIQVSSVSDQTVTVQVQ